MRIISPAGGDFGYGFDYRVCSPVIRAPFGYIRIVSDGHYRGGIGLAIEHRKFLGRYLNLCFLVFPAERHQYRSRPYGGIEHLHKPFLRQHVPVRKIGLYALPERVSRDFPHERVDVLHRPDFDICKMLRAGTVYETARHVHDGIALVKHLQTTAVGDIRHVCDFYIFFMAVPFELFPVGSFHYHRHPFLGFGNGQFRSVQAAVLDRNTVEPYFQSSGKLPYGHAHPSGAEVIGLFHKPRDLRPPEKPLQLALLRGIAFLHLRGTFVKRFGVVLFGRACGSTYPVTSGTSSEHKYDISSLRGFPAHGRSLHSSDDGTDLKPFRHIVVMINFPYVSRRKPYLVAVARIARGGFRGNHFLRKFSFQSFLHAGIYVARPGHAHRLIHVTAAGQRVPDGASQTGGGPAERLYLGRMVMGFVLELEQPFLGLPVHVDIHIYAACIIFFTYFQIVEKPFGTQVSRTYRGHVHQADILSAAAEFLPHPQILAVCLLHFRGDEGIVYPDMLYHRCECRMAAVVAPIRIEDTELRLVRITAFPVEIFYYLFKVRRIHRKAHLPAIFPELIVLQFPEPFEHRHRAHFGLFHVVEYRKVLHPRLHGIHIVFFYSGKFFGGNSVIENEKPRRPYIDISIRLYQMHAVDCGSRTLVELPRKVLHRKERMASEIEIVRNHIGYDLAENTVTAFFKQFAGKPEEIVYIHQPQPGYRKGQIAVQFVLQAVCLDPEPRMLFDKNPVIRHIGLNLRIQNLFRLLFPEFFQFNGQFRIGQRQDGNRHQTRILRSVDGHGCNRNPGRHLYHGQKRIEAVQRIALHRDPYHGKRCHGRHYARKMGSTSCTCYYDLQPPLGSGRSVFVCFLGCAVSADD